MVGRWLAIAVLGFTVGAATVLLVDSGDDPGRVGAAPAAAASPDPSNANAAALTVHEHNHVVRGVKAADIQAELQPDKPLDRATRAELAEQLAAARAVAMRYPTVADATAAGYVLAGGFAPGSGAHYVSYSGISGSGPIDINKVNSFIYDGTNPDSRIVGLMYYSYTRPEGFAGPNDHWHRHSNVCVNFHGPNGLEVPFPADAEVTLAQCRQAGGSFMPVTGYMVHAWVVPGWESPQGVFSHENPNLTCVDGTLNSNKAGFCQGT